LILDLSKGFTPNDLTGLRMADLILLVCELELSSLRNVVRMLQTLSVDATMGNKVRIVLNRVGNESEIHPKKAEEITAGPLYWQIPNEPRIVADARNNGVPLVQHAPKSKVQQSIAGLALALCGKEAPTPSKEKPSRWALFSRR
jgi:pilus assembly protein CpaE